jgi:Haem-NO-binding
MYGMVNKALQHMVEQEFGLEAWQRIRERAGVDTDVFVSLDGYPDEITYRLVGSTAAETGRDADAILHAFGRFWVLETATRNYSYLMSGPGQTFEQFLIALPNFHTRISLLLPNLVPPEFHSQRCGERCIRLHYRSTRLGLAGFVEGLLAGLADHFKVRSECRRLPHLSESDNHTVFEITWTDGES